MSFTINVSANALVVCSESSKYYNLTLQAGGLGRARVLSRRSVLYSLFFRDSMRLASVLITGSCERYNHNYFISLLYNAPR